MGRFILFLVIVGLAGGGYYYYRAQQPQVEYVYEVVEEYTAQDADQTALRPLTNVRAAEALHLKYYIDDEEQYLARCPPDLPKKVSQDRGCNIRPTKAVPVAYVTAPYQAQIAAPADYPWPDDYRAGKALWELRHYCGGALIAPGWIITAAHCVDEKMVEEGFGVRLGMAELSNDNAPFFPIDRVVVHPGYNPEPGKPGYVDDIALVHYVADDDAIDITSLAEYWSEGRIDSPVLDARLLAGGDQIMTWSGDGTQRIWDIATGKELVRNFEYRTDFGDVASLFGEDAPSVDEWLISLWRSGVLDIDTHLYDDPDKFPRPTLTLRDELRGNFYIDDSDGVATYQDGQKALFWVGGVIFVATLDRLQSSLPLPIKAIESVPHLFDGDRKILTTGETKGENPQNAVQVWNAGSLAEELRINVNGALLGANVSSDESEIVSFGGRTIDIWNAATGAHIRQLGIEDNARAGVILGAKFFRNDTRIVGWTSAYGGGEIYIWDAETGERLQKIRHSDRHLGDRAEEVFFIDNGTRLLTRSRYGIFKLWDVDTGARLASVDQQVLISDVYIFDDGARVLGTDHAGGVLWDMKESREIGQFNHNLQSNGASLSPDRKSLLTFSGDGTARLWDTQSGVELKRFYHSGAVNGAAFIEGGSKILSWSDDGAARIWNADTGRPVIVFDHNRTPPDAPLFDPAKVNRQAPLTAAYIDLPHNGDTLPPGAVVDIFGWGKTRDVEGYEPFASLLWITLTVLDQETCSAMPGYGPEKVHDKVFCASDPEQKTCKGDSGGPVVYKGVLVGLVSWGKKQCDSDDRPGIYTRVSAYTDWIEETMSGGNAGPQQQ